MIGIKGRFRFESLGFTEQFGLLVIIIIKKFWTIILEG